MTLLFFLLQVRGCPPLDLLPGYIHPTTQWFSQVTQSHSDEDLYLALDNIEIWRDWIDQFQAADTVNLVRQDLFESVYRQTRRPPPNGGPIVTRIIANATTPLITAANALYVSRRAEILSWLQQGNSGTHQDKLIKILPSLWIQMIPLPSQICRWGSRSPSLWRREQWGR